MNSPGAPFEGVDTLANALAWFVAAGESGGAPPALLWWWPLPLPLLSISCAAAPIMRELRCAL